ncbi:MAG: aldo/keto reductase [Pseudomonadota bacterium]
MKNHTRKIGSVDVGVIGLGCMNLSHGYGPAINQHDAKSVLFGAVDRGVKHFDTAALYGFGKNEELVGDALKDVRKNIYLASKCGMTGVDGKRVIDGRPEALRKTLDEALIRLQTDVIDLYYLHRFDKLNEIPIEESVGEMGRMVEAGKVKQIGLSEVSADTIYKAHTEFPIAAVQSEYSLWSRNVEVAVLDACKEIGAAFVAFSPLGRGFLADLELDPSDFSESDIRRGMPRFQSPHFEENRKLRPPVAQLAEEANCTPAQLALCWLMSKGDNVIPIPGTTSLTHLEENIGASSIAVDSEILRKLETLLTQGSISGGRYPASTQEEIDTEELPAGQA